MGLSNVTALNNTETASNHQQTITTRAHLHSSPHQANSILANRHAGIKSLHPTNRTQDKGEHGSQGESTMHQRQEREQQSTNESSKGRRNSTKGDRGAGFHEVPTELWSCSFGESSRPDSLQQAKNHERQGTLRERTYVNFFWSAYPQQWSWLTCDSLKSKIVNSSIDGGIYSWIFSNGNRRPPALEVGTVRHILLRRLRN